MIFYIQKLNSFDSHKLIMHPLLLLVQFPYSLIGTSLSEPHTSESPTQLSRHRPCANNYRKNVKLTSTSCHQPCHGEINDIDYRTSLFVSCRRPCHGEINGIHYRTSLFVSCCRPCHSEINSIDYRISCSDHAIEDEQRRKTMKEERVHYNG